VQAIAESTGKQKFTHHHLGFGVFALDAAHIVAAGFYVMNVSHIVLSLLTSGENYLSDGLKNFNTIQFSYIKKKIEKPLTYRFDKYIKINK
jgi:hypothetical protein